MTDASVKCVWFWTASRFNLPVSWDQRPPLTANEAIEDAIRYTSHTVMDSVLKQQRKCWHPEKQVLSLRVTSLRIFTPKKENECTYQIK